MELITDIYLRDYFIAHAPAEPQNWFSPVMETKRPESFISVVERDPLDGLMRPRQRPNPAASAWDHEHEKRRYTQWPAAWADAMLTERGR